ncbi:MAG: amino acid ABC transporter permease [Bacteriovoracia bacterium]
MQIKESRFFLQHPYVRAIIILLFVFLGLIFLFSIIGFLLHFAPEPIGSRSEMFIDGAKSTLLLTLISGISGIVVGIGLGLLKASKKWYLKLPTDLYISIFRGTPLLVQILFAYYALPELHPVFKFTEFQAAALALALNVGAYNSEAVHAGILAVPKGQVEASLSLGMSTTQTYRWIILPQALRIMTPPLVNNIVALLKDSSLASSLGLLELTLVANRISAETFQPIPVLTTIAIIYLILTTVLTSVVKIFESKVTQK